jgi:hypothetical protein
MREFYRADPEQWKKNISAAKKGVPLSPKDRQRTVEQLRAMNIARRGIPRSPEVRAKISQSKAGIATVWQETHGCWRGDDVRYGGIHQWLNAQFGKPKECQNSNCLGRSTNFDWALKRGMRHKRKRKNYVRLCRSCHRSYDTNVEFMIDVQVLHEVENAD